MSDWFYVSDGERQGPVSQMEIENRMREGTILETTKVWQAGMEAWIPIQELHPNPFQQEAAAGSAGAAIPAIPGTGAHPNPPPRSVAPKLPVSGIAASAEPFPAQSIAELVEPFNRRRGWVITAAVFYTLLGALAIIGALGMLAGPAFIKNLPTGTGTGGTPAMPMDYPDTFFYLMGAIYLAVGGGVVWMGIKLFSGSAALSYAGRTEDPEAMKKGLKRLSEHFLILAITAIICIILYVIMMAVIVGAVVQNAPGVGP